MFKRRPLKVYTYRGNPWEYTSPFPEECTVPRIVHNPVI